MGLAAQAVHDMAQLAVIHIHHALPRDATHIYPQLIAVLDMRIQHGGEQVVRSPDSVEVTREVQVDVLHGDHLRVSATCSSPLDAEHGSERRLAQGHDHVLAAQRERICQTDGGGGLALARRRGVDGCHQDELAGRMILFRKQVVVHLGLVLAVRLKMVLADPEPLRHLGDPLRLSRLRYLDIREHAPSLRQLLPCASDIKRSPSKVRSGSTSSISFDRCAIWEARPPVATTFASYPSSSNTRRSNPSTRAASPMRMPLASASAVLRPIACGGAARSTEES